MYSNVLKKIIEYDKIIIHRHSRPDGDALGTQIGLREALRDNFPNKEIYAVGDINEKLSFIGTVDIVGDDEYNEALVFVLDTSDEMMISDERYRNGDYIIKIDHHIPKKTYGDLAIVDTSFESCASLVSDILIQNNLRLGPLASKALFTGIVTDSGRFRYESVTPKTFQIASKLLESGFKMTDVYSMLYTDELKNVRLRSIFTLKFQLTKNNVAYIMSTKEDVKEYGMDFSTISRGMVNTMSGIKGIDIWVNFTEDESNNLVVAEIRSNKYNINQIASKYGGGGHLLASGASLKDFEEAQKMLDDLDSLIQEGSDE